MSNNDLYCSKCKSHHHPADCPLDTAEITPDKMKSKPLKAKYLLAYDYKVSTTIPIRRIVKTMKEARKMKKDFIYLKIFKIGEEVK